MSGPRAAPAAPFEMRPLGAVMGAEVSGVDLRQKPPARVVAALGRAFLDHLVLCLRGQVLGPREFVRAAGCFGEVQMQIIRQFRHETVPEVSLVASFNRDGHGDGRPLVRGPYWHTDDSFLACPAKATVLHAVEIPERGGDTWFANMYAVYDALDPALRERIAGLRAVHRYHSARAGARVARRTGEEAAESPDVSHPLVRTHPETGRRSLYVNPNRIDHVEGLTRGESDRLLDALYEVAFDERFHYRHRWRAGDMLLWDNRCTMHHASDDLEPGARRLLHRILLAGTVPV